MDDNQLIEIKNLSVTYTTERAVSHALNNINLNIRAGESIGLVGESGAGKTTTALSILNLLPFPVGKITQGDILYKGKSILKMNKKELEDLRGDRIAMIFQNPLTSLNPTFTVGEQIAMVLRKHRHLKRKEAILEAGKLLETVGIPDYRVSDYPHQFSGGMRQRVGIAAGLACNPELLIADEPTTALDVTIQAQILELMKDLQKTYNTSLLMITHNLGIISELCEKVAVIYGGAIIEYGTVREVFKHPMHPYMVGSGLPIETIVRAFEQFDSVRGVKIEVKDSGNKYTELKRLTNDTLNISCAKGRDQLIEAYDRGIHCFMPSGLFKIYVNSFKLYHEKSRDAARKLFYDMAPLMLFTCQKDRINEYFHKSYFMRRGIFKNNYLRVPLELDSYREKICQEMVDLALQIDDHMAEYWA